VFLLFCFFGGGECVGFLRRRFESFSVLLRGNVLGFLRRRRFENFHNTYCVSLWICFSMKSFGEEEK
jgi:hypothetical protein